MTGRADISELRLEPGQRLVFAGDSNTDGDTAVDLERRWQDDVLALRPDWLFVMI